MDRTKNNKKATESNTDKPLILVCNDDGIRSEGLSALALALRRIGEVYVVAPDREQSAVGHSLTLHRPLRFEEIAPKWYSVDGTPTDCVTLAVHGKVLPRRPTLVVSGINKGANLGEDVSYSGTVSAAMEGTLLGIPSIAISLEGKRGFDFAPSAKFAAKVASTVLKKNLPKDTLLNINIPHQKKIKGVRLTSQGKRIYGDVVIEKEDPRGKKYYWIGGDMLRWEGGEDTDFAAITKGYISITPIHLDMTNYSAISELQYWNFKV
ncbi:MAG: 5'/3'-nucleotidase SurE [Deltaproteobacteria bacterium]|nr:5'/3'-nucleotidase SurE [Deltaproteobacteria bacterium]